MVNRIINISSNERLILQVYDTSLQMFDVCTVDHTAHIEATVQFLPHSDQHVRCDGPALFPLQRHPVVWNCWYQRLMLLGDVGITVELSPERPLNWNRWLMPHELQHTKRFLLRCRHYRCVTSQTEREEGQWDCAWAENQNTCCFVPCGETYLCMCFQRRDGRLKPLQSFWYTLYCSVKALVSESAFRRFYRLRPFECWRFSYRCFDESVWI